jgi:L-arabinonolactonase
MIAVREIFRSHDKLGEVPVWDSEDQALWWVDIEGRRLHRYHPDTGTTEHWSFDQRIGSFALRKRGGLVCAFERGFAFFDPPTGRIEWVAQPDTDPGNRFNDGKCDRNGRFWAGTMDDGLTRRSGSLYRLDADLSVHVMETGICISNALAWSPDDTRFYFCDTPERHLRVYDYDAPSGAISNRRLFADLGGDPGNPDGGTVDCEGYVWSAQWDGWRLVRYAPDGTVDRVIMLPVQKPTSVMFGGGDLRTLFVTSAIWDLEAEALAHQPFAGSLLALEPGVAGLAETRFAG